MTGAHLDIDGDISAFCGESVGIYVASTNADVDIGRKRSVTAFTGIYAEGAGSVIDNDGGRGDDLLYGGNHADISAGMVQNGANVEIHLGKNDVLTVNNVTIAALTIGRGELTAELLKVVRAAGAGV